MVSKSVLITGCSEGGIGKFHRKGLRVFATARNLAKVELLKNLGLEVLPLDVVDEASIKQAAESVRALTGGTLDFLVNNSGYGFVLPLLDTEVSEAKKIFDVNVFGVIEVCKAFAPLLIASKGTIINIGSVAGTATMPWQGYYNASKAVIHLLTSQLRIELSPFGVNAICVVGGVVRTKFFDNMPTKSLPSGSLYAAGAEEISIVQSGAVAGQDGWDADVFAHSVVTNAMKRTPKLIHWTGDSANVMWYVGTFLWGTFWDLVTILPLRFKFRELTAKIHAAQKSK